MLRKPNEHKNSHAAIFMRESTSRAGRILAPLAVSIRSNKAYSLIEILVVLGIIGTLSAIAIPRYTGTVKKARNTKAMDLVEVNPRKDEKEKTVCCACKILCDYCR